LIASNGKSMKQLIHRLEELLPKAKLVDARHENSFYLEDMTSSDMYRNKTLGRVAESLSMEANDNSSRLSVRTKHLRRHWDGHTRLVAVKSKLHGTKRGEYPDVVISSRDEEAIHSSVPIATEWYAHRVEFETPEKTRIYIQDVSGYGYTLEIEDDSEEKVDKLAANLGLTPISENLLETMYGYYQSTFTQAGDLQEGAPDWLPRHFSDSDWVTIAAKAGEKPVFNQL